MFSDLAVRLVFLQKIFVEIRVSLLELSGAVLEFYERGVKQMTTEGGVFCRGPGNF